MPSQQQYQSSGQGWFARLVTWGSPLPWAVRLGWLNAVVRGEQLWMAMMVLRVVSVKSVATLVKSIPLSVEPVSGLVAMVLWHSCHHPIPVHHHHQTLAHSSVVMCHGGRSVVSQYHPYHT